MHFVACELLRDHAHLFEDVILTYALSEGRELPLDVGGLLPLQGRRTEFVATGTMACRARRNAALRLASKDRRRSAARSTSGMLNEAHVAVPSSRIVLWRLNIHPLINGSRRTARGAAWLPSTIILTKLIRRRTGQDAPCQPFPSRSLGWTVRLSVMIARFSRSRCSPGPRPLGSFAGFIGFLTWLLRHRAC